jgi:hypothetical protein
LFVSNTHSYSSAKTHVKPFVEIIVNTHRSTYINRSIAEKQGLPMKEQYELDGRVYISGTMVKQRFSISNSTLNKWKTCNILPPSIKIGRSRYYPVDDIDKAVIRGGTDANGIDNTMKKTAG